MKWQQDLVKDIRFGDYRDDLDCGIVELKSNNYYTSFDKKEFSDCNKINLINYFLKTKDKCKTIVEIGVHRNGGESSTWCFLNNKKKETLYLGIDIEDKSFLVNKDLNVFTLQTDSGNTKQIIEMLQSLNRRSIDFLFIDGWHSINQVLKDWELTEILSYGGIVGFHDTNNHPGPKLFVENLNSSWEVRKECLDDYGISFVWKK